MRIYGHPKSKQDQIADPRSDPSSPGRLQFLWLDLRDPLLVTGPLVVVCAGQLCQEESRRMAEAADPFANPGQFGQREPSRRVPLRRRLARTISSRLQTKEPNCYS